MLAIDGFEGPLDWLLELARARRIDLARLSIAALADAFAAALTAALANADPSGAARSARARRVPAQPGRRHHRHQGRAGRRRYRAAPPRAISSPAPKVLATASRQRPARSDTAAGMPGSKASSGTPPSPISGSKALIRAAASAGDQNGGCGTRYRSVASSGKRIATRQARSDLTLDQEAAWAPIQVRRGQDPSSDTGGLAA